jgi:chemotaxis protein methyltransferase CheR
MDSPEWRHLLSRITVKESYLFRGRAQMAALESTILEELAALHRDRRLKVWCAGCARGEEAVTLAIVIASHPVVGGWDWRILATDVDDHALDEARRGRYGERAVARVPAEVLESRFEKRGDTYQFDPTLLSRIEYRRLNLIDRDAVLDAGPFDVIFLRNVLIYFRPEQQRRVVETVERALAPDGVLFLGPSESLLSLGANLRPRNLGSCFCYRWPPAGDGVLPSDDAGRGAMSTVSRGKLGISRPPEGPRTPADWHAPDERIRRLLEAFESADFEQARKIALTLRHEYPENPIAHALVGFADSRLTDFAAAVLAYRGALYLDPSAPEIRFLLAVALESDGRVQRALREFRSTLVALGSDPAAPSPIYRSIGLPARDQLIIICRKKISDIVD